MMDECKGVRRECEALRGSGVEVAVTDCEFVVSVSDQVVKFREECGGASREWYDVVSDNFVVEAESNVSGGLHDGLQKCMNSLVFE